MFGSLSWSKDDSNYSDEKLNVFTKDDNIDFRLVQNLTTGSQISTNSCGSGTSWSVKQKILVESKRFILYRYQQRPETWMNNLN